MSKHDGTQATTLKRPGDDDISEWMAYWKSQGQPWRVEPEIDYERQKFLAERLSITPNIQQGIYPFKDIKLNRADVEWLLATHENGRGPIDWSDEGQRGRYGLDLRGANLRNEYLAYLPLACTGRVESEISVYHLMVFKTERADSATIHLEGAELYNAHLEHADFSNANLENANFDGSHLEKTEFNYANLKGARFWNSNLMDTEFINAHLEKAELQGAHLEGAILRHAHLEGANIQEAILDNLTQLNESILSDRKYGVIALADVQWGDTNLAVVNWAQVTILGDELVAVQEIDSDDGDRKVKNMRKYEYETAARAYRQLSVALRNQGINEDAARFTYRAQLMQRKVFWYERKRGQYLFSGFLDLLSGYGYKPWRCFAAYLLVIIAFATTYFIIGHTVGPVLSPLGSVVFSMTSFHGRGFFPGGIALDDLLTVVAALEAFIGLLIEVTFIATLTQRLFGK